MIAGWSTSRLLSRLALQGRMTVGGEPEHAPALRRLERLGYVRCLHRCAWTITRLGRARARRVDVILETGDLAAWRRDVVEHAAMHGDACPYALARELGITRRRVSQIMHSIPGYKPTTEPRCDP